MTMGLTKLDPSQRNAAEEAMRAAVEKVACRKNAFLQCRAETLSMINKRNEVNAAANRVLLELQKDKAKVIDIFEKVACRKSDFLRKRAVTVRRSNADREWNAAIGRATLKAEKDKVAAKAERAKIIDLMRKNPWEEIA